MSVSKNKSRIRILDLGIGNLFSVVQALLKCGEDVDLIQTQEQLREASHLVLPGVGSFKSAMESLHERDLYQSIIDFAQSGKSILGICLGMQILSTVGYEQGIREGLNLIPGEVRPLKDRQENTRIPNMGWRQVTFTDERNALNQESMYFYFAHSFEFIPSDPNCVRATSTYGKGEVVAAIESDNFFGVQFHPEKSGDIGYQFIKSYFANNG